MVALVQLVIFSQYCLLLANVGRNTFEHVQKRESDFDATRERHAGTKRESDGGTFDDGVFAEAKAADAFAREQLSVLYVVAVCLGALAIWPAVAKREPKL